jgi:diguanylate cyclase (GGDEF)-like protein
VRRSVSCNSAMASSLRMPAIGGKERVVHKLRAQINRFDVALGNITQGVCFFDGRQRLILANRRYAEIYGLSSNDIRTGASLERIVALRFNAGTCPNMSRRQYLAWRASIATSNRTNDSIVELQNGRVISIHHRPMPDGGWVSTHEDITERRQAEDRLAHMASHDPLTGLSNRTAFRDYMDRIMVCGPQDDNLAVLCLDLDHFKHVNDTFGHAAGDALLCSVSQRIRDNIRVDDIAVRLGGDEFAVVQAGVNQPCLAVALATRLIEVLSRPFELGIHRVNIGTSVGIAYGPAHEADAERLLTSADMALYRAKADGRGTYRVFEPVMTAQVQSRFALETGLRAALLNDELELFFQPIVKTCTGRLSRFEALVRWRHPQRGLVQPSEFIGLAEDIGVIVPLGEWVLQQACKAAAQWPSSISVAVNLSPVQFKSPNLTNSVLQALQTSGISPNRLELEITETVLLKDTATVLETLREFQNIGVRISLDDFGTGYSSIGYLRTFPFDSIKIDRSFVSDLRGCGSSLAIVNAILTLGRALGMSVTAEGVETRDQLGMLKSERCTEVQGYLFSPPVPSAQTSALIARLGVAPLAMTCLDQNEAAAELATP